MEEKRKHKRLDLDVRIELERVDSEDGVTTLKYVHVDTTDISRSGIGFYCKHRLEVDTKYNAQIQIWTKEIVETVVQIVRREDVNQDGLCKYGGILTEMTDKDALKIDIYQIFKDV